MDRLGSLWVWSQVGSPRWTWRWIWNHLHAGGDPDEAAATIGTVAGLGDPAPPAAATFPQLASQLFAEVGDPQEWSWRCAWTTDDFGDAYAPGLDRFGAVLSRYRRTPVAGALPTIARIWCAVRAGSAEIAVDQQNLRVWAWNGNRAVELRGADPTGRLRKAAAMVGSSS